MYTMLEHSTLFTADKFSFRKFCLVGDFWCSYVKPLCSEVGTPGDEIFRFIVALPVSTCEQSHLYD